MTSERVVAPHGATAGRPGWSSLPAPVRAFVERRAGVVVGAVSQNGGFTSGFASRLTTADGSRVFVKAAVASNTAFRAYRQEALVSAALPSSVPAPRLLWWGEVAEWIVLAFEEVEGAIPARPWRAEDLDAVMSSLTAVASALTPAPVPFPDTPSAAELDPEFSFWRRAAGDVGAGGLLPTMWRERLGELAEWEAGWAEAAAGGTVAHFDVRADNLLLTPSGRVLLCDWNWVTVGAPWLDMVMLMAEAHGDGHDVEALLRRHPLTRDVAPEAITAFVVALAGYFVEVAARPPLPASPWLRVHQAAARDATLAWLAERLHR